MLHTLASGMKEQWQRHELLANNLANISTTGFKRDDLMLRSTWGSSFAHVLGSVVSEPRSIVPWTDFSQGPITETGRSVDVALSGAGFLVVETPAGRRYTRAGALSVTDGYLTTLEGLRVLGDSGRPIALREGTVTIGARGEVQQDGREVDTLRLVDFARPYRLLKEGRGLFVPADPAATAQPASSMQIVAGALEGSNVNAVDTMVTMIELLRTYEACQRALQAEDEINRHAANEMGRV